MSPERTAPTSLRQSHAQHSAAPDTARSDGFAALLGAVDHAATPVRPERRDPGCGTPPKARKHDEPAVAADPAQPPAAPVEAPAPVAPAVAADAPVLADPLLPFVAPVPAAADASGAAVTVTVAEVVPAVPAAPALATPPTATPPVAAPPIAPVAEHEVAEAPAAPLPLEDVPAPAELALPDATPADAVQNAPDAEAPTPQAASAATPDQGGTGSGTAGEQHAPRQQPAAVAPADSPAPAPSATPAQAASAPAPLTGMPFAAERTTPLHQAPRAVAQVIQVAQERDISHAKLNLRPIELGGIEIRLQSSAAGVTAQVIADSPEAARLLQQAAADLRRSLERQDVTLLSLDVSTAGDGRPDGSAGASADLAGDRARHFAAFGGASEDAEADDAPTVVETLEIADGVHIDVLA